MNSVALGWIALVLMGISVVFDKLSANVVPALPLLTLRTALMFPIYLALFLAQGSWKDLAFFPSRGYVWIICSVVLSTGGLIAYYTALRRGPVSLVHPLISASPLISVAIATLFLRERLNWERVFGIGLTLAGLILLSRSLKGS